MIRVSEVDCTEGLVKHFCRDTSAKHFTLHSRVVAFQETHRASGRASSPRVLELFVACESTRVCHTGGGLAKSRLAKLNDLVKKCGGQWLSRLLSVCSIGGVTVVLTGEIVAGLKHQYHTKLTIKCYGFFHRILIVEVINSFGSMISFLISVILFDLVVYWL